jgi:gliding motility-associated-like protein
MFLVITYTKNNTMRTTKNIGRQLSGLRMPLLAFTKFKRTCIKVVHINLTLLFMMMAVPGIKAQVSGGWNTSGNNGTTGYTNHGNGVIQLLNNAVGCAGAAVHETSDKYDPTGSATFSKCYKVFFGCPGNDEIGINTDKKGDGMAFSFSKCGFVVGSCGGGLGYTNGCPGQMITIEFDTWKSPAGSGFDANYGGGTTGNHDEVALHRDGVSGDGGRITSADAGNLEDGLEHEVCITYDPNNNNGLFTVTIDGVTKLSHNFNMGAYFGSGGLNQSWSAGKDGADNQVVVSDGADITDQIGIPLCPASVLITSPSGGTSFGSCFGPITINAVASPPAGNTIDSVEFFVGALKVGVDNTDGYSTIWSSPTIGNHELTAKAHYMPSGTSSVSSIVDITVGGGIELTSSAPIIDGVIDPIWDNYTDVSLDNELPIPAAIPLTGATDLSATFRTIRNATHLFILVEVVDNAFRFEGGNNWDDDGVEIFIDMGNDKSNTYGLDDYQFAFVYNKAAITEYKHNSIAGVTFAQGAFTGGYTMEISIPWSTLGGAPVAGELIGFDLHVNDDDGGNADLTRDSKIAWNDAMDIAHSNPTGMGTTTVSTCNPCPTGTLSGSKILCNDGIATSDLSVLFTGVGPWSITYSIDGVTQPAVVGITNNPLIFSSGTVAATYELLTVTNTQTSGCIDNATGLATISLSNFPIGHDGTFTPPGTAVLSVDNTGATYEWYDAPVGGNLVFTGVEFTVPGLTDTAKFYVQETPGASCRTEVKAIPLKEFFIPNLITPNSDGKNDRFEIIALPNGTELKLFNRWGSSIYQTSNYDNLWAANDTTEGLYYFDLTLPDGKQFKGWLNVIK